VTIVLESYNRTPGLSTSSPNGELAPPPIDPVDLEAAKAVLRFSRGHRISQRTNHRVLMLEHWGNLLQTLEESAPDHRHDWPAQWLKFHAARNCSPERIESMRRALVAAEVAVTVEPDEPETDDDSKLFNLELIDSATFFSREYSLEWYIEDVSVRGEPTVTGGPQKSLKTSVQIAKAIALGTGTDFLGRFRVPRPVRVGLISGESGRRAIQSTARQVCLAQGIEDPSKANVFWGFKLPQLTVAEHIRVLERTISDNGIEYLILDPLYLMILAGQAGVNSNDMYAMGPILTDVSQACAAAGADSDITHHFVKRREDPFGAPEMGDLAGAGVGQYMRQWCLVASRQAFDAETGKFYLHFAYGGSAGHGGAMAVDIEVGKLRADGDARKWIVSVAFPSEANRSKQQEKEAARAAENEAKRAAKAVEVEKEERKDKADVIAFLRKQPGRQATESQVRASQRWRADKAKRILFLLVDAAEVCTIELTVKGGHGAAQKTIGYRLNEGVEVSS
jgi:hypothetical protein